MSQMPPQEGELQVFGALLQGYAQACVNLNIVAGRRGAGLVSGIEVMRWYSFDRLRELEGLVLNSYENNSPILERVGVEMMSAWYHYGPGKEIVKRGVDFLAFQTGSQGYASVIKGPPEQVGTFQLIEVDPGRGTAKIHSTTPLNRDMERGVLIGGMLAPGDLSYVEVVYKPDEKCHYVEYH